MNLMIKLPRKSGVYQNPSTSATSHIGTIHPHVSIFYNNKTRMKKNNYTESWYKLFSLIFLFAVGAMSATAQTASTTGDWTTSGTWTGGIPSTTGTSTSPVSVTVNTGVTLTVSTSITGVYNIAVNGTGILSITSGGVLNATNVTVAGTGTSGAKLTMVSGAVLNVTGNVTINAGATSTWVPPSSAVTGVQVQAYSGGGGGGGASSSANYYSTGGGAGGNYISAIPTGLSTSTVYSIAAGAGGAGGTTSSTNTIGGLGTASTFSGGGSTLVSIPGGTPGYGGTAAQKQGLGGVNGGGIYLCTVATAGAYLNSSVVPKLIVGTQWAASTSYSLGQQVANGANLYTVTVAGTSTSTAPTNTSGSSSAGTTGAVFTYAGAAATATASLTGSGPYTLAYVAFTTGSGYTSAPSIIFDQPWSAGQTYAAGYEYSTTVGNLYQVTTAGTSGTSAPTGTGSSAFSATGGTATYTYLGVASTVRASSTAYVNALTISTSGAVNYSASPTIIPANATYYLGGAGANGSVYLATSINNESGGGGSSAGTSSNGNAASSYSSTAIPWLASQTYSTTGQQYISNGNLYSLATTGTSGTSGPTGTGSGITVTGGTATFNYVSASTSIGGAAVTGGFGPGPNGQTTSGSTGTAGTAAANLACGGGGATSKSAAGGAGGAGQVVLAYTSLVTNTGSLVGTTNTYGTASTTSSSFTVSGYNVSGNLTISDLSGNFQVSCSNYNSGAWGSSVLLTNAQLATAQTINIRMAATAAAGTYASSVITLSSTGYSSTIAIPSSTVSKATLTVSSGVSANNKAFDNTNTATFSYGSAVLSGYQNSDGSSNVSISAVAGTFASVGTYNATTNLAVTISSITLGGAAGGNYQITSFPSLTANITPTVSPTVIIGALGNSGTFGNVTVGDALTTTFTLTTLNLSGVTTSITAPSGYTVSPTSVTGNVSTTITVTFTPSSATSFSGNISGAATGATTANSAVTGTGVAITSPGTSTALNIQYTSDNTQKLNWSAPTGSTDGVLIFQSTSSGSYTPSGAGSAYTVGTSYSGYKLVATASTSATSAYITGLTNGQHYYYQIFSYAGSNYSAGASSTIADGATAVPTTSILSATTTTGQSVLSWTNPSATRAGSPDYFWDSVLVIAYPTSGSISAPTGDGRSYVPNASYGLGTSYGSGYVVYNGTGSGVTVTQLPNLVGYTFAAYVRHGSAWSAVQTTTGTPTYAVGDYVSIASGNYYASPNTVWGIWNGTSAAASTSSPGSASNVWVVNGYTVTVTTTSSSSASASSSSANCNNLYVIGTNSTLVGANTLGATNPLVINGTNVEVSSGGTVGVYSNAGTISSASGNNANGITFFIDNTGTTTIYGNAGKIDLGKIAIAASGNTLAINESLTLHYHGTSNGGGANGLIVNNSSSAFNFNNNTVTINNGATLTMDRWSSIGLSSSNQTYSSVTPGTPYAQTFTLNVNGVLTFLKGMPDGATTNTQTYSNNGYLSFMTSTVNGATLNVGSTGVVNLEEFYPNGLNTSNNGGLGSSTTCVINIAAGGSLNVDSIADFRNASQTIAGAGTFQLNSTKGNRIKIGSTSGLDGIFSGFTGTTILPTTNVMYCYEGVAAQNTGSYLPATVSGLRIGNASGVTLHQSTTVTDSLKLDYGLLNTSTYTLTLGATANDSVSTASSTTSYVNGNLSIVSSASQSIYFPIGNSSVYSPVTLNVTQSGTVTYASKVTTGSAIGYSTGSSTISGISPNRYYNLTSSGGSVSAAYVTLGYNNNASYDGSNGSFNTTVGSRVRVIGSANSSSALNDLGGSASIISTGVGTITSTTSFPSLGNFAIGEELSTNQTPPTLTASGSATVAGNYNITYTDPSGTWTSAISSITFNGTVLSKTSIPADYSITNISGNNYEITIMPHGTSGLLRTSGTFVIDVVATNYDENTVDQTVGTGPASQLLVHTVPVIANNAAVFTTQPVIYITDAYNNLVTTATDNIKVTSTGSNAGSWTLGGTTTVTASGGIATFTNLYATSNTALTVSFLFTSQNASPNNYGTVTASSVTLPSPPTYYWVGGSTAASSWTNSGLWSTTLGGTAVTPTFTKSTILIFDGSSYGTPATGSINTAGTSTTTADTIAQIILRNGAVVNLNQSSGVIKYGLAGNYYGSGLTIDATSKLSIIPLAGTDTMMLLAGATADIYGVVVLGNANQQSLVAKTANAIKFYSGSSCTINQSTGANPFGNSTFAEPANSVVFQSGSSLTLSPKVCDIFAAGSNTVSLQSGSNLYLNGTGGGSPILDNHMFGNIIVQASVTPSSPGSNGFTCSGLTVQSGTFAMNETGGSCSLGAVSVSSGATLNLTSTPTYSSISNSGTINYLYTPVTLSGTIGGTVGFTGTTAQSVGTSGTATVSSLTVSNASGVTQTGTLNIAGTLTLTNGNFNVTGATVTLKSTSISNSATVAQVITTSSITGNVTVERFIPKGFRGYRDMAPEVYGAGTIKSNWQENGTSPAGYGTFITGPTAYPGLTSNAIDGNGFDETSTASLNTQDYTYDPSYTNPTPVYGHFKALTSTSTNLNPFTGYRLLIRGDRTANLYTSPVTNTQSGLAMFNETTLRATGQLITGTVTYSTTNVASGLATDNTVTLNNNVGGFSLVANPYVCPVLWGTGSGTQSATTSVYGASANINGSYWYLDPTYSATGRYLAFNALTGSSLVRTTGGDTSYNSTVSLGYIQPGQAVFVQTFAASPTVVFKETAKAATSTKSAIFGTASLSKIYVSLMKQTTGAATYDRVDGAAVAFRSDFGNKAYGAQDALKLAGATDNLSISDKGKNLSIDGRLPATASDAIALAISKPTGKSYQLQVDASAYASNGFAPVLYDAYKNTTTKLGAGVTTVDFTIDTAVSSSFSNRFTILFTPSALPVNSIVASASLNNKVATITWNTVGEKGVARYEVEKSTDAKTFATIGQSTAKNTATASYATTDNSVTATTYYRIKAVSTTGAVSYSNVAKLSTDNRLPSYSLYPNPLKGSSVVNISLTNVVAGKYTVSIYNALGQKVNEQTISHTGGSATHALTISNGLAAGVYNVAISEAGSKQLVHQSTLSIQP